MLPRCWKLGTLGTEHVKPMSPELRGQSAGVVDVFEALRHEGDDLDAPLSAEALRRRLEHAGAAWPQQYRGAVVAPLVGWTERWTEAPPAVQDAARAVMQRAAEPDQMLATLALQELVSDIYDGFLSEEDRRGFAAPDRHMLPPLVKWGNRARGPYIHPAGALAGHGIGAGVVNMPQGFRTRGLAAWTIMGHEVAGHDILVANEGLVDELAGRIVATLHAAGAAQTVPYWIARLHEAAADVLGILNLGPSLGAGLLVFLRGHRAAMRGLARLCGDLPGEDHYPADLLRGVIVATTVSRLRTRVAARWVEVIDAEVFADLRANDDPAFLARWPALARSAALVAQVIAGARLDALGGRAFEELQNWSDHDEALARALAAGMARGDAAEALVGPELYAAHAVAGATYLSLEAVDVAPGAWHDALLRLLAAMHLANPRWRASAG